MRRLAFAIALACILLGVARAGEMPSTGAVTPEEIHTMDPMEPSAQSTVTITGEMPSTGAPAPQASSTILTIIVTIISIVP